MRYLRSIFVPEDETCFFLYQAQSADAVLETTRRAALRVERVAEAVTDSRQKESSDDEQKNMIIRRGTRLASAVLVLAVLVSAGVAALQALGGPGLATQPAFAKATGDCLPAGTATRSKIREPPRS